MCHSTSRIAPPSSPTPPGGRSELRGRSSRTSRRGRRNTAQTCATHSAERRGSLPKVIVTGSGGLIGSESVAYFAEAGYDVVGVENDMRATFFGPDASTAPQTRRLLDTYDA